jgi:rubrerythrin
MGVKPAAAEIVASAVAAEKEASLFYTMLAEVVSQADVAKRLKALAGDEANHARQLVDLRCPDRQGAADRGADHR